MRVHDTEKGFTVVFGAKDYESMSEDTGDTVAISIVAAFVIFLLLI